MKGRVVVPGFASMCVALPLIALAHHSFAQFDMAKRVPMSGTVKQFQWTNPHAFLQLEVRNAAGESIEWSFELGSPNMLARSGLRKGSFKAGDELTVEFSPLRSGEPGGTLRKATLPDGQSYVFSFGGNVAEKSPP